MTSDLLREIAQQIVREEILQNWKFYALLLALGILATVAGNWLSAYVKKRAETYATKADLQEVLRQLQATTRATEEVRTAVSHADWVAREWRATRRTKLEELLNSVYALDHWLEAQQQKWIYKGPQTFDESPMDRISVLVALYFPELRNEADSVLSAHHGAQQVILDVAQKRHVAENDPKAIQAAMDEFIQRWKTAYPPIRQAIMALESRTGELMREIAGA
jgi:hypothetical protein